MPNSSSETSSRQSRRLPVDLPLGRGPGNGTKRWVLLALALPGMALSALSSAACSDDAPASGSGGTPGAGASAASGGTLPGTGAGPSTGGAGTGGGSGGGGQTASGFSCPEGAAALVLDLSGKTPSSAAQVSDVDASFLEGPVWVNGNLFVSNIFFGSNDSNVLKLVEGQLEPFLPGAGTNGLAVQGDTTIIGASHQVGGLVSIDATTETPSATTLVAEYEGARLNSPNDLTIRSDGQIYFTDPDWQCSAPECPYQEDNRVYRYLPDTGSVEAIASGHSKPNGITLAPDEGTLYVGGDSSLQSYPVMADGSVGTPTNFGSISGSDGNVVDCAGNLYVTTGGNVTVLDSTGTALGTLTVPGNATNVAFGGPAATTLYITTMQPAGLYEVELNVPGFPY